MKTCPDESQDQIPCLPARMNPYGRACRAGNTTGMTGNTTHWSPARLSFWRAGNSATAEFLGDSTRRVESYPDKDRESIFGSKLRRANDQDLKY